ncbi:hypothetical protein H2O64_20880 [Kordia sp. YSTF-M3]|uniref:ATP-grasp domain-containing protein n=1 Tax=Kordia aestuariivivens TaxID=2759037 RepID=A0ABR7QEY5_9FLAO|nr:hypothetical protein [Kordia aestuariivivens]MBC8757137.1 hypothetical protein [Kordia aestuariivivens]
MIYVISEAEDVTTNYVLEWLLYYKKDFIRRNFQDVSTLNFLELSNDTLDIKIDELRKVEIKKIWHRRARTRFTPLSLRKIPSMYSYLKKEEEILVKSIENILKKDIDYIGSFQKEDENYKIDYLLLAKKVNLKIPDTLVTTSKEKLYLFFDKHASIITKDLRYPIRVNSENFKITSAGTTVITAKMLSEMKNNFAPSLFQERIDKQYEIRIFFFKDKLYPMAILSQNDESTSLDYRNYNNLKPNRNVPVLLPSKIEEKVINFIKSSELNTGSIDLILSTNNEYIFLEVNPQGQFDWVSKNCNYYIEKDIAEYLIN